MKKIIVVGSPGSGKSTFSRRLSEITGIRLYHLDLIYHNPDRTTNPREYLIDKISDIFANDSWIIDGQYMGTIEMRLRECDTVFFLDLSVEECLKGVAERIGKPRSDMPWVEEEEDPEFIEYVKSFEHNQKPRMEKLLEKYRDKNIIVLKSHEEADEYLEKLRDEEC